MFSALFACAPEPRTGPPDLVLVSIDTLRADRLGAYGSTAGLSPNMDRFAAESVVFEQAWAQSNFTLASHAAVLTGRYPSELGPVQGDTIFPKSETTLPGVLSLYGYATAAFTGGGMLGTCYGLQAGFGEFDSADCTEYTSLSRSAPRALQWRAKQREGPSFSFIHGYDSHQPYLKPSPWGLSAAPPYPAEGRPPMRELLRTHQIFDGRLAAESDDPGNMKRIRPWDAEARAVVAEKLSKQTAHARQLDAEDLARVVATYDGAVSWADAWFGWMIEEMDAQGWLGHSVVVLMSDHGESLGEDGRFGHAHSMADRVMRVPLMVRMPGPRGQAGERVGEAVALFDLFPTLLELAGAVPPAGIAAKSLLPWIEGGKGEAHPFFFAEGKEAAVSCGDGRDRLVFTGIQAGSPYMALALGAAALDGPAFSDSSTADLERRAALRDGMMALQAELVPPAPGPVVKDPAVIESMRRHGYWERQ